jgi:hypothetical protein
MGKHYIHEYLTPSDNEGLNLKFDNQQKTFFGLSFLDSEVEECFVFDIISIGVFFLHLFEDNANFVKLFSGKNGFIGWNGTLIFIFLSNWEIFYK